MPNPGLLRILARSFLAGGTPQRIAERSSAALGHNWRWLRPLAIRYRERFAASARPSQREAIGFLRQDEGLREAWARHRKSIAIAQWIPSPAVMQPVEAATVWHVPPIETTRALETWLQLNPGELEWLADRKHLNREHPTGPLQHYYYRLLAKRSGGLRVLEVPKSRLKFIQRQILKHILDRVPVHPAAHGFIRGRSIRSFIEPHTGQIAVLRMDLQNFFPAIPRARIAALFRTLGYPESVAEMLGGLCTHAAPASIFARPDDQWEPRDREHARWLYTRPHLPQGAPTSPSLANLCAYRVDCRLSALAAASGATYTRYADDLAFSGGIAFAESANRFAARVASIVMSEGFAVNFRKTRLMRQGVRQYLAGLVVNQHGNLPREHFDELKATLTNCVRHGAASQNRAGHVDLRAHLAGRVGYMESIHAVRGAKLRRIFNQIAWE